MFEAINANHTLGLLIAGLSSLFWTITYVLIIRCGAKDRTYGMPLVALGANLSWEAIFLVVTLSNNAYDARLALLLPWALLDVAIVVQCFRYGKGDFHHPWIAKYFHVGLVLIIAMAAAVLLAIIHEFDDAIGWYAAFGQNLMMSILFVCMLLRRDSVKGQSIYIAIAKFLGTLFAFLMALFWSPPTLHEHWAELLPDGYYPIAPLLVVLYGGIFLFDVLYIVMVHQKSRELSLSPWRLP